MSERTSTYLNRAGSPVTWMYVYSTGYNMVIVTHPSVSWLTFADVHYLIYEKARFERRTIG